MIALPDGRAFDTTAACVSPLSDVTLRFNYFTAIHLIRSE